MVVEAQRVSYRRGGLCLVRSVSVAAGRGEFLAIVGDRGSGAATLWRLLAGELAPDAGRVIVRDGDRGPFGVRRDPRSCAHGPDAARALLEDPTKPPILLLEQPTAGDRDERELLARCRARADEGAAVIATVSDAREAAAHAHTLAVIAAGRLVSWAAPHLVVGTAGRVAG